LDQVTRGFNPYRFLRGIGVRQVRLAAGLVLFSYLLSHFINHSLGNISLAAMEYGLWFHMALWRSLPGTLLLYPALAIHGSLGLWALYQRRHFKWKVTEAVQLIFGLSIPALLCSHVIGQRLGPELWGLQKSYGQTLYNLWLIRPDFGVIQVTVLLVAWIHGCIGMYLWLRLRPFFPRIAPVLLAGAVLLPSLALLGFYQQGRVVLQIAQQQPEQVREWRSPARIGTPAQRATLENIRNNFLLAYAGAIGLVFLARGVRVLRERRGGMIRLTYPDRTIRVPKGLSVLEASFRYRVPHASVCGGKARCSTCRIRIIGDRSGLPRPSGREAFVLERVGASADPAVRLACQLRPQSDIALVPILPPQANTSFVYGKSQIHRSEERYLVCMFVDMRNSTEMAQKRLPFDTVFIINRFLAAVSQAVMEAGGQPNQYLGDGLLALFGLNTDRTTACRQALNAAAMVAGNVDHLNKMFAEAERSPIRFGVGIHAGEMITGDIGYRDTIVFTAVGDTVNVAARLQDLTKEFECQVVLSDEVLKTAALEQTTLPSREIVIRGHSGPMTVRTVADAAALSAIFDTAVDAGLAEPQERLASVGAA
jgi:adenylate cyclase